MVLFFRLIAIRIETLLFILGQLKPGARQAQSR